MYTVTCDLHMPARCVVRGCRSVHSKGNINLHYHKIPKDKELRKKWLEVCDVQNANIKSGYVCGRHFEATAFQRNLKYELLGLPVPANQIRFKTGAVPKLRLPNVESKYIYCVAILYIIHRKVHEATFGEC